MRIKISENQLSKINRLNENTVNIDKHIGEFQKLNNKLNGLSNKITFVSIDEILKGEVNLAQYLELCEALEQHTHKIYMNGYEVIDAIPEDEYDSMGYDFDMILDNKKSEVSEKITLLENLVSKMIEISENSDRMLKAFSDNKPLEV